MQVNENQEEEKGKKEHVKEEDGVVVADGDMVWMRERERCG